MNVKKIIIIAIVIIVICAACFFGGYSCGRNKFNDNRINKDTELIRKQDTAIENIETGVERATDEVRIIESEIIDVTESARIIDSGFTAVEKGLQKDIEGISGVIERLQYYRKQGEVLEKDSNN